jgi:galactokinase
MNHLNSSFARFFGRPPRGIAIAPGRVNLIGEHTDYNEGFVLPVAIDRAVTAAFAPRSDRLVHARSLDFSQDDSFSLDTIDRLEGSSWANYVRAVAAVLQQAGYPLTGIDIAIHGDIPVGAGLSSSAALEVAVLGALQSTAELEIAPRDQALLTQRAENQFVGVNCGIMDQMTSILGRRGHALFIDCRTLETELIPLDLAAHNLKIVVAQTGVTHTLSASAYNQRRDECSEALRTLSHTITERPLLSLRDITPLDLEAHAAALPEKLARRARHVVNENERVLRSVQALREGDFTTFGGLLYASHESLRRDYEVSCPELDLMVNLASNVEGVVGARMTGAGFGGCTVNLVYEEALDRFRDDVIETYRAQTGLPGEMYVCQPADGLHILSAGGGT